MPILIGAKPESSFADPIGLLTDCHRRIERFLSVLLQVSVAARGEPLNHEERSAFETALRYFREAAPEHTFDEEQTLFPRLRQMPELKAVLTRVEWLEDDHVRAAESHAEVDRLGQAWLASGTLSGPDEVRLLEVLDELSDLYLEHIAVEEGEVFPLAAKSLTAREREAMGSEMAARRGLSRTP